MIKTWVTGEEVAAADLNANFAQTLTTQSYTAGEGLTAGNAVYLNSSDGKVYKSSSNNTESCLKFVGIATQSVSANAAVSVQTEGLVTGVLSGLTVGSFYYISSTAGSLSITETQTRVGIAISTTTLLLAKKQGQIKFGGTGADGALTVSSGNTNIDLGGVAVFVKNYSSISITGTGSITFTNPHNNGTKVVIRCLGDCTLTSSTIPYIDVSGCGGNSSQTYTVGLNGVPDVYDSIQHYSSGNTAGYAYDKLNMYVRYAYDLNRRFISCPVGSGSAGGQTGYGGTAGGYGGRGGGSLYMEVGGTLNMSGIGGISVAGKNGTNGGANGAGGGGGGSAGVGILLYNFAGTITGNINDAGGNGGNGTPWDGSHGTTAFGGAGAGAGAAGGSSGRDGSNQNGGGGGGGANILNAGSAGASSGTAGGSGATSTGGLVLKNDWFS